MTTLAGAATLGLWVLVLAVVAVGAVTRNPVTVLNGLFAFAVTLVPLAYGFPRLAALWVALVSLLHALGSAGWYRSVWWWDHLAHTASGGLIAAIGYAAMDTALTTAGDSVGPVALAGVVVLFALACGVLWELFEVAARDVAAVYDLTPLLKPYGLRDVTEDLLFDALGAVLAVAVPITVFVPVTNRLSVVRLPVLDDVFFALLALVVLLGQGLDVMEHRFTDRPSTTPPPTQADESLSRDDRQGDR